ncbi:gamma-glutamyl hydrolase [Monosiga brevicollis MX1]|uniref:folate gamma-glutamyl hydrolase n=1 Tax=Monosiga brevicollis TaxID=81824 RepID=A9VAD8_MONBE|nr:gamma-glutamyl hydrolase [Monosiga brevicollis MX1]EDQ85524.1 gamma-glutamyl hydrolase [Monosiga brevicollis MX1]|eukprot:XP_001749715.1 gamma-glutamyl hydrolase [Monosiga brevicollis MX1]
MAGGSRVAVILAVVVVATAWASNPVIGILSQSDPPYIAASYVKYLESAGARVVPVLHNDTADRHAQLFSQLNGFLIPGGGANLANFSDDFMVSARYFVNQAIQANTGGDFFPVWGTCLGFETLSVIIADDPAVLVDGYDSEDLPLALNMTRNAGTSRLFGQLPGSVYDSLQTENVTMNFHQSGVEPSTFVSNDKLNSFFNILSTNVDLQGKPFVSSMEGKTMPVYGVQWHPEKNTYEWGSTQANPHSAAAVDVAYHMARFFVNEARKNNHVYPADALDKPLAGLTMRPAASSINRQRQPVKPTCCAKVNLTAIQSTSKTKARFHPLLPFPMFMKRYPSPKTVKHREESDRKRECEGEGEGESLRV